MQSARRWIAITITSIICLSLADTPAWSQPRSNSKRQPQKQKSGPKPQGIDAEAKAEADNLLNMFFTRCGDSYYHYIYDNRDPGVVVFVEEWRGFRMRLFPDSASAADRLNGIEWSNDVGFSSDARREYRFSEASWSKWLTNPNLILLEIAKVDGKWLVNRGEVPDYKRKPDLSISDLWMKHLGGKIPPDRKVKCEDITAPINH